MERKWDGVVLDTDLLIRAQSGDREAQRELARRYRPQLQSWVRDRLPAGTGLDADDLVEEALTYLIGRLGELQIGHKGAGALHVYLRQALINRIRDRIRARWPFMKRQ